MPRILVLNGPNLNRLGRRETHLYGNESLESITRDLEKRAREQGCDLESFQSNAEHELVERIHRAGEEGVTGIIFNAAAFTHTSIALRDALLAVEIPFIEVHISNVHGRETWRRESYFSDIAVGVIAGLGAQGYGFALDALLRAHNESSVAGAASDAIRAQPGMRGSSHIDEEK